jgi:UDP-N-acetylmuramoyl-tripeptide--D-alanyl-D-alanine ligase
MNKLLPLLDHLYIFQNFEYEPIPFLKWFIKNPLKRDLQKKHQLDFTLKAVSLIFIAVFLQIILATFLGYFVFNNPIIYLLLITLFLALSPLFLVTGWVILYPIESYRKRKIISAAKEKLKNLPDLQVVAITGSFAKTSTKDILYTLLWKDFRVVKTPKSFNTEISIARSILSDLKKNTEIFLVEMDAYHPGEINKLASLVTPDIGVITSIAPQHLERFGSMEKLAKTQFELAEALTPGERDNNSLLVLNGSNEWIIKLEENYQQNKLFFGENLKNDNKKSLYATNIKQTPGGILFNMHTPIGIAQINLPLYGEHHIQNFLAASAAAINLGASLKTIQQRANWVLPTPHRLEVKKQGQITIIDNTYNTNPLASKASLEVLKNFPGTQKILITPGLVELGDKAGEENEIFIKNAASVAHQIIIVGQNAKKYLVNGLKEVNYPENQIVFAKSTNEAINLLPHYTRPNAVVLLENDLPDQYS